MFEYVIKKRKWEEEMETNHHFFNSQESWVSGKSGKEKDSQ